ncbi:MAG: DUF421 domain-containing protein [Christensenellales bacterium]
MNEIVWVLINSSVSFLYLFVISKLLGKKQIAQLEFIDYAVGISLGSIAAEMATADDPFYHYLIAMTIFFLLAIFIDKVGRKSHILKKILKGSPIFLIESGKLNYPNIKKANIDINDLLSLLREKGYFNINDIEYAMFETSGKLSVMPKSNMTPVVVKDFKDIKETPAKLTHALILDGKILTQELLAIDKTEMWLTKKLKIMSKKELKSIALAIYDNNAKQIIVHYKNQNLPNKIINT